MTQAARTQEPSMEEILASIRRIIADDDAAKTQADPPQQGAATAPPAGAATSPNPRLVEPSAAPPRPQRPENVGTASPGREDSATDHSGDDGEAADILDLTESMEMPSAKVVGFRTVEADADVVFDASAAAPEPKRAAQPKAPVETVTETDDGYFERVDDGLMSSRASAAVDSAFNALAHTVLLQNSRTLDDVVREMLRPMLKTWLDDNLPSMVERMVRAEIERVSRGRG